MARALIETARSFSQMSVKIHPKMKSPTGFFSRQDFQPNAGREN